jgi:predicted TIM-barrel fold metal-dependent hydrolase
MSGRIDAHHHLWDLTAVRYPWLEAKGEVRFFGDPAPIQRNYPIEEFTRDAKSHGFGGSVHIQVGAADGLTEARWVQSVAENNPDWPMAQVVFCDLTSENLEDQLKIFNGMPTVRGVRQIVGRAPGEDSATGTNALLDDPAFLAGLRQAAEFGFSFDLQLLPELMPRAASLLAKVPQLPVALCHAGSPHDRSQSGLNDWAKSLKHLSNCPNVSCKLSGLGMFEHDWTDDSIRPIVDTCLDQFGPERCMFGSNFPVDSLSSSYGQIVKAYDRLLPESVKTDIFGRTARKFYRLDW